MNDFSARNIGQIANSCPCRRWTWPWTFPVVKWEREVRRVATRFGSFILRHPISKLDATPSAPYAVSFDTPDEKMTILERSHFWFWMDNNWSSWSIFAGGLLYFRCLWENLPRFSTTMSSCRGFLNLSSMQISSCSTRFIGFGCQTCPTFSHVCWSRKSQDCRSSGFH